MSVLATAQVIVTSAGARIVAAIPAGQRIMVSNRDAANSAFFGSAGVTVTTGVEIKPAQNLANAFIDLPPETECWVVTPVAQTARVDVTQVEAA